MPLTDTQTRYLRKQAHALKPIVIIGQNGLTDPVVNEIVLALEHHELMKVRVNAADREARQAMIEQICERTGSELVQALGHVASLFRKRKKDSRIQLPK